MPIRNTRPIRNSRTRVLLAAAVVIVAGGLGGCADYLNHSDDITFAADDAQNWNIAVQTIDPWPPASRRTVTGGDGERIAKVTEQYINPPDPNAQQKQTVNVNINGSSN